MTTISIIRSSWEFFRKQPALLSVGFWLLFLPMLASDGLTAVIERKMVPEAMVAEGRIAIIVLIVLLALLNVWGQCCVLVTGKRMLQTKAGRSRTSFRATASQAKAFIIPLLLTNILYACIIALWTLPGVAYILLLAYFSPASAQNPILLSVSGLFALPAVIAAIRMVFFQVIVVGENTAYRAALKRSKDAVRNTFWKITGHLALLIVLLFVIPMSVISIAALPLPMTLAWEAAVSAVNNAWIAVATILLNLCLILIYEKVRAPKQR